MVGEYGPLMFFFFVVFINTGPPINKNTNQPNLYAFDALNDLYRYTFFFYLKGLQNYKYRLILTYNVFVSSFTLVKLPKGTNPCIQNGL